MSITKETIKETIKTIMAEEGDYKAFFKKALEKAGKDIPSMSDEEKKEFFNKIDAAWDGKGEKNEGNAFGAAVTKAKKDGDDEFEVGGKTYKVEESNNINEGYSKSMGYNAVDDSISRLTKSLDPNGILCKSISKKADNVKSEFKQMKRHIDSIDQLWGEVDYVISMSNESVNESTDCGCGCGGVTEGGCSTNLPIELSEELTFEINTFLERPVLSKNNNKITVENSELSNLIPTLVKNEIHKRLSSGVKREFIELLKNYK